MTISDNLSIKYIDQPCGHCVPQPPGCYRAPGFFLGVCVDRAIFLIDGFNLYHSLNDNYQYRRYKWLDISKLAGFFIKSYETLGSIYYFTAYATWSQKKRERHKKLIKIYRDLNITPIMGVFRWKDKKCKICKRTFSTPEEKRTDVNIAIELFDQAYKNIFDTAYIMSGDSDLIPAINRVKENFPDKKIKIVIPIGRRAKELTKAKIDGKYKIKESHLNSSLLSDPYVLSTGQEISCPSGWK